MGSKLLEYFKGDELAANVWQAKYAQEGEETPDDMHKRMAKEFAKVENDYSKNILNNRTLEKLSDYGKSRDFLSENKIYNLFKNFKYIIPQGSIMSQLGAKSIGSLSNCFVVGQPEDSYGGIFQKDEELAQLMKRRGGVGIDISTLRPEGTATSNAAKSSTGAVSFMHRFSNTTREVAQNGRRGALMISIDINHPDVLDFVKIKRDLSQVTGANISIKLNDEFMKAVENDGDYFLKFPCDSQFFGGSYEDFPYNKLEQWGNISVKRVKAKKLWDEIIKSAHNVAEPGLMFWDAMVDYSPDGVYPQFKQITTNPCSEIGMQPYDACRLIAVNLYGFVDNPFTPEAKFNFKKFYEYNYEAMRLSDNLIDLEIKHIDRILNKIESDTESSLVKAREFALWRKVKETAIASRRTGLGLTAMGDTLAALGLKYDSDEGLEVIEKIMHIKMESELDCTIDMAVTRGTFEGCDNGVGGLEETKGNSFYKFLYDTFPSQYNRMRNYGRRNVSWSTVAPTGTVSLLAQTTSGLEPLFMPYYMRRKKVNPSDENVKIDFTDQNGDTWQEFAVLHPKFKDWLLIRNAHVERDMSDDEYIEYLCSDKEYIDRMVEVSPWYEATANDIDWIRRVEIQGVIQKYITHSISSTINLPEDVSEEEVSKIYLESWKKGLKGITVYRDGSRSGVLVSQKEETSETNFDYHDAPKRPKELKCDIHTTTLKGDKYNVIVGILDDKPYEIFICEHFTNEKSMDLVKIKKGRYDLIKDGETYSEDITTDMTDEQEAITRLLSTSLRHGADIKFLVEQLGKTNGDMFTFTKSVGRVLKKYIPDGTKSTATCNDCGSDQVIFQEGCMSCQFCGSSACS